MLRLRNFAAKTLPAIGEITAMNKTILPLLASALLLPAGFAAHAQQSNDSMTGTSHPEALNDTIESSDAPKPQKPSPAVPAVAPTQAAKSDEVYTDRYVPYKPAGVDPTATPTPTLQTHTDHYTPGSNGGYVPRGTAVDSSKYVESDPRSGVVTTVELGPNDLPVGTRIQAALNNTISTKTTAAGTRFAAEVKQPVMREGRVIIPAGTVINGRVTQSHGGRRISGASAIRLQPDTIILPNRAVYRLNAEVTELDHFSASHVNREGVITNTHDNRVALGAGAVTTTSGLVAGAMMGGPVGAGVGAGIGAGIGVYWWLREDHQQTLPTGTEIVFSTNDILALSPMTETPAPANYSAAPAPPAPVYAPPAGTASSY